MFTEYRWEYSALAGCGNQIWKHGIDPLLRLFAGDELAMLRRVRGVVQVTLLFALLLIPVGVFYKPGYTIAAAGLLFDIAGVLRVFLLEDVSDALSEFGLKEHDNIPSVALRELIMPEASGPYDASSPHISLFYYKKRGVLFLFVGFMLQFIGNILG